MRNETINPRELIHPRCDWHLSNWADWMQNYQVGIGYGHKSSVFLSGNSSSVDDMCDEADRHQARVIDSIIGVLPHLQQLAIHNVYIADVWKSQRENMAEVFVDAAGDVWRLAVKRGLE